MSRTFAVIDAGSNAIRLQIASVDQPGSYRIVEQERRAVRLGHRVFQTGKLDKDSRDEALEVFRRFKAAADRADCAAVRAVGTSAMREASDAASFIRKAGDIGVPLEVLAEKDEARLISLGILSGLRFVTPLGLFMDIGGGSVEIALGNRNRMLALFSEPLGAVRLTERFVKNDPPADKEIVRLQREVRQRLAPVAKRIARKNFSMAFGSGGTMTALADADARFTGDTPRESLYVLRRARLRTLFDLLCSQPLDHADAILGDTKRGDILVAGAAVLLSLLNQFSLDYIFISRRGLRDGLMVDLLTQNYPQYDGGWRQELNRSESLEEIGEKYNYDKTHCKQVSRLAVRLFEETQKLHKLPARFARVLRAAAMLHDIGLFIGYPKHHKHSYYLIKSSLSGIYDEAELDLIANVARYHRKAHPTAKHVQFSQLSSFQQEIVRKLSAILRVADALDYDHQSNVDDILCKLRSNKGLAIHLSGKGDLSKTIDCALEKSELMNELYDFNIVIE
jgi:exopolyphosphatase / guanosine-5'-triphosphate,3'-diphosphate pyrophosphatase